MTPAMKGTRRVKARRVSKRLELRVGDRVEYHGRECEVTLAGTGSRFAMVTNGERTFWAERAGMTLVARAPKTPAGRRAA